MKFNYSEVFDRDIAALGFGCWGIGGYSKNNPGYGYTDDDQSIAAIHSALDYGVNYFDTANIYGDGRSEEILGRAIHAIRERVVIATKAGKKAYNKVDFSPKSLTESIYNSLKRLKTDYIDLLQLHDPETSTALSDDILSCLLKLKSAGVIKHIGASLKSPADATCFIQQPFEIIQINLNLIDQRAITEELFFRAKEKNIEIVTRTPLAFGFLTSSFEGVDIPIFQPEDHRSGWSKNQIKLWHESPKKFQKLIDETKLSITELALRFSVSQQNTICLLSGMINPSEVAENAAALCKNENLSEDILNEIYHIYKINTFFLGGQVNKLSEN
jgi:aryl-alcohol dehydrogenase-like predicted oxidoreductase